MVMSDWGADGSMQDKIRAGNDINMPGGEEDPTNVKNAILSGSLAEEDLNVACYNILSMVVRTTSYSGIEKGKGINFEENRVVSENAAEDTIVLLKNNNNTLPLSKGIKVAVYGNGAVKTIYGGFGDASVTPEKTVSIIDGINQSNTISVYNYKRNPFLNCSEHSPTDPSLDVVVTENMAKSDAAGADVAVIVISRNSREGLDRTNTDGDYKLNTTERDMVERVQRLSMTRERML